MAGGDRRWWWESFRRPGASRRFAGGDGWRLIPQIVPDADERVWFIAEDCQLTHYPVFETSPRIASRVVGECFGFEYYIVAKDFSWLLCETHHDDIVAIGSVIESKLAAISP